MERNNRRSTLRSIDVGSNDVKTQLKRRISFSGKNSVRVFSGEEEPKSWSNSYEISDNLNGNGTAIALCAPSSTRSVRIDVNDSQNKENIDQFAVTKNSVIHFNPQRNNQNNFCTSNKISVLNSNKYFTNVSNKNTKMYEIENSHDITRYDNGIRFNVKKADNNDQTTLNLYSFSLEEHEKEVRSIMFGEKTVDFMRELRSDDSNKIGNDTQMFASSNPNGDGQIYLYINQFKEKKTVNVPLNIEEDNGNIEKKNSHKSYKSTSFSFDSPTTISSPESTFSIMPLDLNGFTLKELNDEIELGNIKLFSNSTKTAITDCKCSIDESHFNLNNAQSGKSRAKYRRTLIFEDADISLSCDEAMDTNWKTVKQNSSFIFNTGLDDIAKQQTNNKCRYSQADNVTLDNTSFLTRPKMSDKTLSPNTSKRDVSQIKYTIDTFDESISQVASKDDILRSSLKTQKSCNEENSLSYMFPNAKPICIPILGYIKDSKNVANLNDAMDISMDIEKQDGRDPDCNNIYSLQNMQLQTNEWKNRVTETIYFNNDFGEVDNDLGKEHENAEIGQTLTYNHVFIPDETNKNELVKIKPNILNPYTDICYSNPKSESNSNDGIPFEKSATLVKEFIRLENIDMDSSTLNLTRNNKNFNNKSLLKKTSMKIQKNMQISIESEEFSSKTVRAENAGNHLFNIDPSRKTLFFNDEIPLQNTSTKNILAEKSNINFNHINKIRKSLNDSSIETNTIDQKNTAAGKHSSENLNPSELYFNNETPFKQTLTEITENGQTEKTVSIINHKNKIRSTLYFNNEISFETEPNTIDIQDGKYSFSAQNENPQYFKNKFSVQNTSTEIMDIVQTNKADTDINHENDIRKTMFFNQGSSFKTESSTIDRKNIQMAKPNSHAENLNTPHLHFTSTKIDENRIRTLYFNNKISFNNASHTTEQKNIQSETENLNQLPLYIDNEIQLQNKSFNIRKNVPAEKTDNEIYDLKKILQKSEKAYESRKSDYKLLDTGSVDMNKYGRRSIYTPESMVLSLEGKLNKVEVENVTQEIGKNSKSLDVAIHIDTPEVENNNYTAVYDNKTSTYSSYKNFKLNKDISLNKSFQPAENYVLTVSTPMNAAKLKLSRQINRSKLFIKQENTFMTPTNLNFDNKNQLLVCMTPRLSLMEFTELEKRTEDEECCKRHKRRPFNLTPIFSVPKKRQTLVFDDCLLNGLEETKGEKEFFNKFFISNNAMDISGIIPNESILQTPPKGRKSRIPIPISSELKTSKSFSLTDTSINNHTEEFDVQSGNLAESIQLLRKTELYAQREDSALVQPHIDLKLEPADQLSKFEGNPITISDVSVFFEPLRKTNIDITQREAKSALDKPEFCIPKPKDNEERNFENRFINLTLEDLDKTRLSLVQLSYEDINENMEQDEPLSLNDVDVTDEVEYIPVRKKRYSDNYVPNISLVCRKCKRCQEINLNESSSSSYLSLVLPELPDIGLDHLKQLRKRPTIAEATVFVKHMRLEFTAINMSDDDNEIEDYNFAVTNLIKKYGQDTISYQLDIMGKQCKEPSEQLPFVLKLDALLRNASANWIFDYQMQGRGILLFTHKKLVIFNLLLTFDEVDPLGHDISLKSIELRKGYVPKKKWTPIDYFLEFQLKLNLPFNIQWLCKGSTEYDILKLLQEIDQVCLDTIKMGNSLQVLCCNNQASIFRDGGRLFVRKVMRKVVNSPSNDFKHVDKIEIKLELLNLKKLSFKDIVSPPLHYFREDIHLLPTGLQFLKEFLPKPLYYLKDN